MFVTKRNGTREEFVADKINKVVFRACEDLEDVYATEVVLDAQLNLYNGITTQEIDKALVYSARSKIEEEPNYSYVASRLLLNMLYKENFRCSINSKEFESTYRESFIDNVFYLVEQGIYDKRMLNFDLEGLAYNLIIERDLQFKYLGLQTVYDRYLTKFKDIRVETPQAFFMRVSMGLSLLESNSTYWALKFYNAISSFKFMPSSPTLFNSGTVKNQLSSCFLSILSDSVDGIMGEMHSQARLSKHAGGLALDMTPIRASTSLIKSSGGKASGPIKYAKVFNDVLLSFDQGGKRKGSGCIYLELFHPDIRNFMQLRRNTGDERLRCQDTNIAIWVPDLFYKFVEQGREWYFICPSEAPELHEIYGGEFDSLYEKYILKCEQGKIKNWDKIPAKTLEKEIYTNQMETGHPFVCFKDSSNIRYPNKHKGVVHSSNLCCIAGDQRVVTDKGILTVKELYGLKCKNRVVGREKIEEASEMLLPKPNSEMVNLITREGYSHKVTPDHKIWVKDYGWKVVKDLIPGDKLLIQQIEGMWGEIEEPDLAFIVGLITGDGCISGNKVHVDIWQNDFKLKAYLENKINEIILDIGKHRCFNSCVTLAEGHKKLRLSSPELYVKFKTFGYDNNIKMFVPEFVWKGTKETVSQYLRGLYIADASIQTSDEITTISLVSIHYKFLQDIQILLANFGIKSTLTYIQEEEKYRLFPDGHGGKKEYLCQKSYRLLITSIKGCKIFENNVKFGEYKNNEKFLLNIKKDGYVQKLYCRFKELQKLPNEDAYCLQVYSKEHSWTVNGLITKNTEILQHTIPSQYDSRGHKTVIGETAVCTLSSTNLSVVEEAELEDVLYLQVRAADNAIDLNFYPTDEAEKGSLTHRYIGIGHMGTQDLLYKQGVSYDSSAAVELLGDLQEKLSYYAIKASIRLAKERGPYSTYEGSEWSKGKFPQDLYLEYAKYRDVNTKVEEKMPWRKLKYELLEYGIRNGNILAVAPNATIAPICGVYPGIDPDYSLLYSYETLSGAFTMINQYFVKTMKEKNLWGKELLGALKEVNGDINLIYNIDESIKRLYATAFNRDFFKLIDCTAERQKWIDQAQSFNIYINKKSMKYVHDIYYYAWQKLLKTTYYCRSESASKMEKVTIEASSKQVCTLEVCESCQ